MTTSAPAVRKTGIRCRVVCDNQFSLLAVRVQRVNTIDGCVLDVAGRCGIPWIFAFPTIRLNTLPELSGTSAYIQQLKASEVPSETIADKTLLQQFVLCYACRPCVEYLDSPTSVLGYRHTCLSCLRRLRLVLRNTLARFLPPGIQSHKLCERFQANWPEIMPPPTNL
ncbi:hypothetical protein TGME49_329620 [Toxoplasma gondii ME49]|uniref:Uncharacterized protein n=4 Tax=Toxoplasma gondii TaxID=5811 RepID=A0A125YVJ1_TOXGV|nr:hypothetical protein TGME49_329620 [Toxoplasma gondii ME49]EPT24487.1 hypothetical protein TGME49_329620 [Toxoplasma gondii ME49]ESS33382.1 hypothetical protein TGVEG_329620 [Toxoplasma gondii VEG]KYF45678.1 hypothetical protein TGARI_329620 [Toxoplasma gondii ARI]PIL96091.1 hypothetical protein TGCOUG_329620 [Toxoplasma gondii COUG]|eukprot:XP_018634726.1 hypothetical protein TGME49_329620 [Toxoplasma gondii ME49]